MQDHRLRTLPVDQAFTCGNGARALAAAIVLGALAPWGHAAGELGSATQSDESEPLTLEDLQRQIDELKALEIKHPTVGSKMKVFGRIHLDAWTFTNSDDGINVYENGDPGLDPSNTIEFRRARLGVSGGVGENMVYKSEIDFGTPDNLAFKDVYFGWEDLPVLRTLLVGNQKRPYGLDALNSSDGNVFAERPFIVEAMNPNARRIGLASYGLSEDQSWNWRYGLYNMVDVSGTGETRSDTLQLEATGRLARTVWYENEGRDYGHLAISASQAFPDSNPSTGDGASAARFRARPEARSDSRWLDTGVISGTDSYTLLGLEGVANFGPTQVTAEAMGTQVFRGGGFDDVTLWGAYIYVSHFLTGEFMPWSRKSGTLGRPKPKQDFGKRGWGALQVAARLSYADFTDQDIFGGEGSSATLGLNWFWNQRASLQLSYGVGEISDRNESVGATTYDEGNYQILGLRLRFTF